MKHLRHPSTVTCPQTGKVYPIPAGGSADDPKPDDPKPDEPARGKNDPKPDDPKPDEPKPDEPKKPWGDDKDFDPDKAWRLIQNLRSETADLKPKAAELKTIKDAEKSDTQRLTDDLAGEKDRADKAELKAARAEAALEHGLSADDLELLGTGTAEEIAERAKKLAERLGSSSGGQAPPASRGQGGGGNPPKASVSAGSDLFDQMHKKK